MASFSEELAKPKSDPTNEGNIDRESEPPMYPLPFPGWQSAEYAPGNKTQAAAVRAEESDKLGKYLVATKDFGVGECVVEDTALLQVPWDLDTYLHTPVHGLLAKMKSVYGKAPLDQGYVQVIARFLLIAKLEPRSSGSTIWSMLDWTVAQLPDAEEQGLRMVAASIHDNIPSAYEGLLSKDDIFQVIRAYDTNGLTCRTAGTAGHTSIYPFSRLAEHHCRPNCSFSFLDHPDDQWASRVQYRALRPIAAGEHISISYVTGYQCTADRRASLSSQYGFFCCCTQCVSEPDLARGFKCHVCPKNEGVVSPIGAGERDEDWVCLQCGAYAGTQRVSDFREHERKLRVVKADKWKGLSQLMGDELLHYTHYLAFRKLDQWAQVAWESKEGETTANMAEALLKCATRVFQKNDPVIAQYNEFIAQVRHGMAEAYTAREHYQVAYKVRETLGEVHTYWAKKTRYMAYDKPLAELMDGK